MCFFEQFKDRHYKLTQRMIKQGFQYSDLCMAFKRFTRSHASIFSRYGCSICTEAETACQKWGGSAFIKLGVIFILNTSCILHRLLIFNMFFMATSNCGGGSAPPYQKVGGLKPPLPPQVLCPPRFPPDAQVNLLYCERPKPKLLFWFNTYSYPWVTVCIL